jgi:hypothetical protein
MGKKIISVDLNFPEKVQSEETTPEVEENKDDYAELKEEAVIENPTPPKPKRKAPSKKPIIAEEPIITEEPIVEPVIKTEAPIIETKEQPKVKCQHCNKEMSMKSLRYSHSRNCLGLKKTIEKVSNEKVSQKTEDIKPRSVSAPPPKPIVAPTLPVKMKAQVEEARVEEHPRVTRMKVLKEKYNSLVQNAFNI